MTDREFIKLNTSIQTASNTGTITEQSDGTIPAVIELRLPDNLFDSKVGNKKIDSVSMLTTKLRLSMLETPIAQVPLDTELSQQTNTSISTCKLDVYPWCIDDDGHLQPTPFPEQTDIAFPAYKKHELTFTYRVCTAINPEVYENLPDTVQCNSNDLFYTFPKQSRFYDLMVKNNLLDNHLMNMTIPSTHENLKIENDAALVKTVSTLEQMWRDALENAITYAMTGTRQTILITLIDNQWMSPLLDPKPSDKATVHIDELNIDACFWKYEIVETTIIGPNQLKHACKPDITFKDSSMILSYDTVAFDPTIPVYWSNSFINNYEYSQQQLLDSYRSNVLTIPPPKRVYKFGVNTDSETSSLNYNFSLPNPLDARVFNIIANKDTRDTFPFLPWIPVNPSIFNNYQKTQILSKTYTETDATEEGTITTTEILTSLDSDDLHVYYENFETDKAYSYSAGYTNYQYEPLPIPDYLDTYLTQNFPIGLPPYTDSDKFVYAVDFWFPENDPGFVRTGSLVDTNPNNRISQFAIFPIPTIDGYTSPTAETDLAPQNISWQSEQTPYRITRPPVFSPPSYSYAPLTPGRTFIDTETYNIDTTTDEEQGEVYDYWSFYEFRVSGTTKYFIPGLPIQGEWSYNQTFKNPSLGPSYQTAFAAIFQEAFRHLPPWTADAEILSTETTIIDDVTYKRGSLMWIIRSTASSPGIRLALAVTKTSGPHRKKLITHTTGTGIGENYEIIEEVEEKQIPDNTIIPNFLESIDETFYMLNGASANMSIGSQEVVQSSDDLFTITDTMTTTTSTRSRSEKWYGSLQTEGNKYLRYQTKKLGVNINGDLYLVYTKNENATTHATINQNINYGDQTHEINTLIPITPGDIETTTGNWINPIQETETSSFDSNDLSYSSYIGEGNEKTFSSTEITSEYINTVHPSSTDEAHYCVLNPDTNSFEYVNAVTIQNVGYYPNVTPTQTITETIDANTIRTTKYYKLLNDGDSPNYFIYIRKTRFTAQYTDTKTVVEHVQSVELKDQTYEGNLRLTWEWQNIPTVILSPIQSFVLILNGMNVSQEIHPINIAQPGSSSLTSSIPIIENYYSMATTLRDLHDELVIIKDSYSDSAFYKLDTTSGQERTITLTLKYITKDGRLHQVYIPKNGVYTLQLTFGIDYYLT